MEEFVDPMDIIRGNGRGWAERQVDHGTHQQISEHLPINFVFEWFSQFILKSF